MKTSNKVISKENLNKLLDELAAETIVMAPVNEEAVVTFRRIASAEEVEWNAVNTRESPKKLFFPRSEKLFTFTKQSGSLDVKTPDLADRKMVLFGVRPCDIRSFEQLDRIFCNETYTDTYYARRRENTIVIGRGCLTARGTCFCGTFDIDMLDGAGADIFLIELSDGIFMTQVLTEKGKALVDGSKYFKDASDSETKALEELRDKVGPSPRFSVDLDQVKSNLDEIFENEIWNKIHERCLGCGACTYLCPTCHCFDMADEVKFGRGERIRTWDSCMFSLFTLHTSGHNPRPTQKERWRQRLMHKFNYGPNRTGDFLCVGCGRCVVHCPVNIDIRQLLKTVEKTRLEQAESKT